MVALGAVDVALILSLILDMSVIQTFLGHEPEWFCVLYPYVLHPLRGFIQTASMYMVVAVSAERFKVGIENRPQESVAIIDGVCG